MTVAEKILYKTSIKIVAKARAKNKLDEYLRTVFYQENGSQSIKFLISHKIITPAEFAIAVMTPNE